MPKSITTTYLLRCLKNYHKNRNFIDEMPRNNHLLFFLQIGNENDITPSTCLKQLTATAIISWRFKCSNSTGYGVLKPRFLEFL